MSSFNLEDFKEVFESNAKFSDFRKILNRASRYDKNEIAQCFNVYLSMNESTSITNDNAIRLAIELSVEHNLRIKFTDEIINNILIKCSIDELVKLIRLGSFNDCNKEIDLNELIQILFPNSYSNLIANDFNALLHQSYLSSDDNDFPNLLKIHLILIVFRCKVDSRILIKLICLTLVKFTDNDSIDNDFLNRFNLLIRLTIQTGLVKYNDYVHLIQNELKFCNESLKCIFCKYLTSFLDNNFNNKNAQLKLMDLCRIYMRSKHTNNYIDSLNIPITLKCFFKFNSELSEFCLFYKTLTLNYF